MNDSIRRAVYRAVEVLEAEMARLSYEDHSTFLAKVDEWVTNEREECEREAR